MNKFYERINKIDSLLEISKPTRNNIDEFLRMIQGDNELSIYFFEHCKNGAWIGLLKKAGEFKDLEAKEITRLGQMKAIYLSEVAEEKPDEVLDIILCSDATDAIVRSRFLDVILKRAPRYINEGTMLIKKYLEGHNYENWHFVGERAAKFMLAIMEVDIDKAFDIAKILLEVWKREKEEILSKDIGAKFKPHEYNELVFKYYKKIWEVNGLRAEKLLAGIFGNYLKELGEDDYSVRSGFYIKLERLDQIGEKYKRDIIATIVGGICDACRTIIEKQEDQIDELLDYLNGLDKPIFERILMYILRFVPDGTQRERISSIIGNRKFLDLPYWQYEYKLLLRDKYEDINEDAIQVFKTWVEEPAVDDIEYFAEWFERTRGRKHTQEDLEKYENRIKASKLYLVREKLTELYEEYREKSGASNEELMPKPMVRTGRRIGPTEGSPISVEDMIKMKPQDAIEYLSDPSRWKIDKMKESIFHTPEEGLEGTFEKVVQQKIRDYSDLSSGEIIKLKPIFLKRYFHGAWNALREKQIKGEDLFKILQRANYVIDEKKDNEDFEGVFRSIVYVVEGIFEDEELTNKFIKLEGKLIWGIVETLSRYEDKRDDTDRDEDPHQRSINCVAGESFTLVVRFGLSYKNEDSKTYEKEWSGKIRSILEYVVNYVKDERILCVLGVWFPQLHWLEKKWIETNLDKIFDTGDDKAWDIVWGTYMSWGSAYKNTFDLLAKRGKYNYAVDKIESGIYRRHDKNPDEGLVEHLMIGYFNGWIDIEDQLLKKFFDKASTELKGKAARFLTTGFKSVSEGGGEEKEKVAKRIKAYWQKRLEAIGEKPEDNKDEAIEFTGWVEDTLLGPKETLGLLDKTLEFSGGEFGEMRDAEEIVERICELGKGNELIALRCLEKATADENIRAPWARYEERIIEFLEQISELSNDYEGVKEIMSEAVETADLYGRFQPDKFKGIWEKLNKRLRESKV